ncbi:hypothetical protein C8Q70DRAFT_1059482 [Cubamyces menziesii]|nr:hypothetical protein C8Q70DRAFT_1059482 [Cubamyces menziesii]
MPVVTYTATELTGATAGERTGGVGSLPGPILESGVTKLPDERNDSERYPTIAGAAAAIAAGAYAVKDKIVGSVPQNAEDAKRSAKETVQSTAQTVKQAVPGLHSTAVTSSAVPSRELFGAQPGDHSSGAGALPGFQDEPHVARLPEESAHPQYDSGPMDTAGQLSLLPSEETTGNESAVGDARHAGGVGALIGGRDESSVALSPDERARLMASGATGTASRTLPSQEPKGNEADEAPKHVSGVGALVGGREEQGAAILPDEKTLKTGTGTSTVTQNKDQLDDQAPQSSQEHKDNPSAQKSGHHGLPNKGPGYDTDYHPAKLHPPPEHIAGPHSEGEKSLGVTQADANRPAEEGRPPHQARGSGSSDEQRQQKARKASFMEKMKGEAKVLLGKIQGKHEKVEEGQRMKAGEAAGGKA